MLLRFGLCCFVGRAADYIKYRQRLEEALVIGRLHQRVLVGDCARVIFAISRVLRKDSARLFDADEKRDEAKSLVLKMWTRPFPFEDERGEEAYDELVYILWR